MRRAGFESAATTRELVRSGPNCRYDRNIHHCGRRRRRTRCVLCHPRLDDDRQLIVPALLFAAVVGVTSQLIGTTRGAWISAATVLAVAFFLRTAADASSGNSWLRWTTPLGWVEELHPPAAPSPVALMASVAACAVLVFVALRMLAVRDIGVGLLPHSDTRNPGYFLLRNPWQTALRDDLPQLSIWLAGSLFYTLLLGSLAKTLLDLVASTSAFGKLLGHSFGLNAYIAASFSVVELIVTLFAVTLVVGARGEEASGRLELLTAGPLSRIGWLLGRAGLASGLALVLALLSAMALWVGAEVTGQSMSFGSLIEAAFNCIPLIVISVGAAVAILAITPRAVAFIYAPVAVFYLWDALGTAIKAPTWTLNISPFHALAEIPAQDFAILPALILTVIGLIFGALGLSVFRGRDLATG